MKRSSAEPSRPLQLAYDIRRLSAGGFNGGIKIHHYEFLRYFSERHANELAITVFCREALVEELGFLEANPRNNVIITNEKPTRDFRNGDGSLPPIRYWPSIPKEGLKRIGIDVLYCGFGSSELSSPGVPQVSLLVDTLHRDFPEALPETEHAARERVFQDSIANSALVQTNSRFCVESLKKHFPESAGKTFPIHLPLHGRFNRVKMGQLPETLHRRYHGYFLYPANYWPHKNHENLLQGYLRYRKLESSQPLDLALTGHPGEEEAKLKTLAAQLDLADCVHFLGHLEDETYKAVWELSSALVFPSRYEGFGMPILEGMYFQKAIACSQAASLPEIAPPQARQFNPNSPEEISQALLSIARNPDDHKAPPEALARFDLKAEAEKLFAKLQKAALHESRS